MKTLLALSLALSLPMAAPALAHANMAPQHGGVVQMSGETLFELVRGRAGVSIYVTDDDEPVAASSATARLSITAGGKTSSVAMRPAAGNRFDAPGLKLAPGSRVAVQVVPRATQARLGTTFTIR